MRIHIDEPTGAINLSSFHLYGWIADDHSISGIDARINGKQFRVFRYHRPDVAKAYPGCETTGFSVFVRLACIPNPDQVTIQILSGSAEQVFERVIKVASIALENVQKDENTRSEKRQWLLPRVSCVRCGGSLSAAAECSLCGHAYENGPILDFIPPGFSRESDLEFNGAICSHGYDRDVERIIAHAEKMGGKVLDCGAGWRQSVRGSVITTEIFPYPTTDVLAVNQRLPFKDGVFDAVLSLHVLEHVPDPFTCAGELYRVLRPGGTLFAVTPMIVPEHGFPHHFFNPTREGLARLFRTTAKDAHIFVPAMGHPINGVISVLDLYQNSLPEPQRQKFLSMTVREILARSIEAWIREDIATALSEVGRMRLAANICIELVKHSQE
jgi:SAM-dependent methyltransferase